VAHTSNCPKVTAWFELAGLRLSIQEDFLLNRCLFAHGFGGTVGVISTLVLLSIIVCASTNETVGSLVSLNTFSREVPAALSFALTSDVGLVQDREAMLSTVPLVVVVLLFVVLVPVQCSTGFSVY
jgi:hypothetical protein